MTSDKWTKGARWAWPPCLPYAPDRRRWANPPWPRGSNPREEARAAVPVTSHHRGPEDHVGQLARLDVVSRQLGHASIATTANVYGHDDPATHGSPSGPPGPIHAGRCYGGHSPERPSCSRWADGGQTDLTGQATDSVSMARHDELATLRVGPGGWHALPPGRGPRRRDPGPPRQRSGHGRRPGELGPPVRAAPWSLGPMPTRSQRIIGPASGDVTLVWARIRPFLERAEVQVSFTWAVAPSPGRSPT